MARFFGMVGFRTEAETGLGVWTQPVVERPYFGDVVRNTVAYENAAKVNDDYTTGNSISIVADAYANEQFHAIQYVEWAGTRWTVSNVEAARPRLILRLGGVYKGELPEETPAP